MLTGTDCVVMRLVRATRVPVEQDHDHLLHWQFGGRRDWGMGDVRRSLT